MARKAADDPTLKRNYVSRVVIATPRPITARVHAANGVLCTMVDHKPILRPGTMAAMVMRWFVDQSLEDQLKIVQYGVDQEKEEGKTSKSQNRSVDAGGNRGQGRGVGKMTQHPSSNNQTAGMLPPSPSRVKK